MGVGQTGSSFSLPAGIPAQVAQQLRDAAHDVFANAYVDAMRATLILPVAVLALSVVTALAVRRRRLHPGEEAVAEPRVTAT